MKTKLITTIMIMLFLASTTVIAVPVLAEGTIIHVDPGPTSNLILISWDGVQRNHLYEMLNAGELPNLKNLASMGVMFNYTISDHRSYTIPGHVQMLTGYSSFITRSWDNKLWSMIPDGLTIFERLKEVYGTNIVNLFVAGRTNFANTAIFGNAMEAIDAYFWVDDAASVTGPKMLEFLRTYASMPFFAFFYFREPDQAGHRYGENSDQYSGSITICDEWLGKIEMELETLGIRGKTFIIVTTDHGFNEGTTWHTNDYNIWLATDIASFPQISYQRQLGIEILHWYGVNIENLTPTYAQPTEYVNNLLVTYIVEKKPVLVTLESDLEQDWGYDSPNPIIPSDYFSIIWLGYIRIDKEDTYTFFLRSDNSSVLYIDEVEVLGNYNYKVEKYKKIYLTSGYHRIMIHYQEKNGTAYFQLKWASSSILKSTIPANVLLVEIPTYDATIKAHCNSEGVDVSVSFTWDGTPYTTPRTFTGQTGSHIAVTALQDANGHPFIKWVKDGTDYSNSRTITISGGGTYTAIYVRIVRITKLATNKMIYKVGQNIDIRAWITEDGSPMTTGTVTARVYAQGVSGKGDVLLGTLPMTYNPAATRWEATYGPIPGPGDPNGFEGTYVVVVTAEHPPATPATKSTTCFVAYTLTQSTVARFIKAKSPSRVQVGLNFEAAAKITNPSGTTQSLTVKMILSSDMTLVTGALEQDITLTAGATTILRWTLKSTTTTDKLVKIEVLNGGSVVTKLYWYVRDPVDTT